MYRRGVSGAWFQQVLALPAPRKVLSMPHKPTPRLACRCENVVNFERVFRGTASANIKAVVPAKNQPRPSESRLPLRNAMRKPRPDFYVSA